jgi:outer membrane receptor protein involved in Fe transport
MKLIGIGLGLATIASATSVNAEPGNHHVYSMDIRSQFLGQALKIFALQTGQQLAFEPMAVQDRTSVALQGRFTARDALETLISKSGLAVRSTKGGFLLVQAVVPRARRSSANEVSDTPAPLAQTSSVEDIVVTANKREESINKVGLTIKALGAAQLEQQRVTTLEDLSAAVPGLNYAQTENATPVYTLRGIGFYDTALAAYPAVSVYLDQAPLPFPVLTTLTLFDIERIEVLKGPQGTLFGNNATGGAINYIAAKPTREDHAGVSLTYSRFNTFNTDAFISGPLTDNLLARLAVSATSGDGWQKSISRPNDTNGAPETFAVRYLMDWRPTDRLRIQTNLNGWRDRSQPTAAQFVEFIPTRPGTIPDPIPNQPVPNAINNPRLAEWSPEYAPHADNRFLQATARADYNVTDNIVFTSLTSYIDYKHNQRPEGDGLVQNRNDIIAFLGNIKSFSQEIRLANNVNDIFRWTLGFNYSHDRVYDYINVDYSDSTAFYSPSLPDNVADTGTPGGWGSAGSSTRQIATNYAAFASGEYGIGQFTLKAGARYTQANRRSSNCTFALDFNGRPNPANSFFSSLSSLLTGTAVTISPGECFTLGADGFPHAVPGKLDQHNLSWRVGVDWKPSNNLLAYVNVAKGYKAGSFPNLGAASDSGYTPVNQESVLTYEGGLKAQFLDRKISANLAVFYSDYTDKQIKSKLFDPLFGYGLALVNVPKSSIKGMEIDATIRPFVGITIGSAATYLDTRIKNSVGPDGQFLITLINNQTNSAGNPIPYASKWTVAGNFNYDFAVSANTDAFIGAQVMHRTKTNASIGDEPSVDIPGYTTLDLQAGINFGDRKYRLMVWGKNVTNEFYVTNRNDSFDGVAQYIGRPATYGVTLSFRY